MQKNKFIVKKLEKVIARMAKKMAETEANTTCSFFSYQAKEPQEIKKLRKF